MGREANPGETYRLIVNAEERHEVFGPRHFASFEQAQARVADAVRCHGQRGPVTSVILQRGNPNGYGVENANTASPRTDHRCIECAWTTEMRWGPDVVQRILTQAGIAPARNHPAPAAIPSGPRPASRRPVANLHKPMLGHVAVTAALVALAMIVALFVQTGGQPLTMLAAFGDAHPDVKDELPFDARTSFTPADGKVDVQPAVRHRPPDWAAEPSEATP